MTDKPISPYLRDHPIRELCECERGPVKTEIEVCELCYLEAQADVKRIRREVIDLDEAREFKDLERLMAGDET